MRVNQGDGLLFMPSVTGQEADLLFILNVTRRTCEDVCHQQLAMTGVDQVTCDDDGSRVLCVEFM